MKSLLYLYQLSVISVATSVSDKMSKFWVYNCDLCEYFCLCVCVRMSAHVVGRVSTRSV